MNKKISVNLALAIAIIAMTVTFSVTMILSQNLFDKTVSSVREKEIMYTKIAEIDKMVRADYYGEINNETLYDMMGAGYLQGIGDTNAK
ncbi:MAG: peptidase, partial [Ruthenibacterium sp.]